MVPPFLLQDQTTDAGSVIGGIFAVGIVGFIYFLPAYIGRKKKNASSITLLNLFLGWSLIGWIVALVWATSNDAPEPVIVVQHAAPAPIPAPSAQPVSVADELEKLVRLRDSGALTETEFAEQKSRALGVKVGAISIDASAAPVPLSIQIAQLRHRHHRGEISSDELAQGLAKLSTRPS
jgi:hypothetical protein